MMVIRDSDLGMKIDESHLHTQFLQMMVIMDSDLGMKIDESHLNKEAALKNSQYRFAFEFSRTADNLPELIEVTYTADLHYGEKVSAMNTHSTFIVYAPNTKRHKKLFKPTVDNNFYQEFKEARYRPGFWRDNPVIRRTAAEERIIQEMEAAGAFGSYFKGKR